MFNLKTASIGIRKAAYMAGVRSGKWQPIHDGSDGFDSGVAEVVNNSGKSVKISRGDLDYANGLSWSEIK